MNWAMRLKITLLQLVVCGLSIAFCALVYDWIGNDLATWPEWWPLEIALMIVTCWLAIAFFSDGRRELRTWFDCFFSAAGFMLLVQYGLAYLFYVQLLPWTILVAGSALAVTLTTWWIRPAESAQPRGILLLGFDGTNRALAPALHERILGVLDDNPDRVASDVPFLGGIDRLPSVVAERRPACVVVSDDKDPVRIPARHLLRLRYAGIAVEP